MTTADEIAFPVVMPSNELYPGLTKRELFAALAMQGLCANPDAPVPNDIVVESVKLADRLIAELNKEQK